MSQPQSYAKSRSVAHETIDGVTILVHEGTGAYYSLDGAGADAWALLAAGVPASAVAASLVESYGAPASEVLDWTCDLTAQLASEDLLVAGDTPGELARLLAPAERRDFDAPELVKYTDMQEFLAETGAFYFGVESSTEEEVPVAAS